MPFELLQNLHNLWIFVKDCLITGYNKLSFSCLLKRNVMNTFVCRKNYVMFFLTSNLILNIIIITFLTWKNTGHLLTSHYLHSIEIILFLLLLKFVFNISLIFRNKMRNETLGNKVEDSAVLKRRKEKYNFITCRLN